MSAPSHPLQRIAPGGVEALIRLFHLYYYEGSDWADEDIGPDGLFDASPGQIAEYINDPFFQTYANLPEARISCCWIPASMGMVSLCDSLQSQRLPLHRQQRRNSPL
jgi:hypothetical protein